MRTDDFADMRLDAVLENCIFYIFPMYEFLHSLDPQRSSASIACCSSEADFGPYQSSRLSRYDALF